MKSATTILGTVLLVLLAPAAAGDDCVPAPTGMIAWWPGDLDTKDTAGGRHGAVAAAAGYGPGKVGDAFSFGTNGWIQVPDDPVWTLGTKDFTIELWVRFNGMSGRDPFIAHDEGGGGTNKWIFWYDTSGHGKLYGVPALRLHVNAPGGVPAPDPVVAPWNPALGQWYHVAVTRSGATFALYIDGVQVATDSNTYAIPDPAASITIGRAEAFYLNGDVDEVGLFGRALSASEIQAIYNAGSAGKCKDRIDNLLWARRAGGSDWDAARAVGVFPDGSSVVAGYFLGSATFGAGEPNETTLVSASAPSFGGFVARYEADGSLAWVRRAGTATSSAGEARPIGAGAFPDGSSVVVGRFSGSATFGGGEPSETTLVAGGPFGPFVARYEADGSLRWAKGVSSSSEYAVAYGAAGFADDSSVVAGHFYAGSVTFGVGEPNETTLVSTVGSWQHFVARYEADGSLRWARGASSSSGEAFALAAAALPDGSSIVSGYFLGSLTLGAGEPRETTFVSIGGYRPFVAKYDADGSLCWARNTVLSPGHGFTGHGFGSGVGAFPDGSSVATGYFYGTATFGAGEPNETTLVSASAPSYDGFVARYEADGSLAWVRRAGSATSWGGEARPTGVGAFPDGSVVVPGFFLGGVTFGAGEPSETALFASYTDAFIARYDSDGSLAWVRRLGGVGPTPGNAYAWGAAASPDGSAIVAGEFSGGVTFGAGEANEVSYATDTANSDIFIACYANRSVLRIVAPASVVQECDVDDEADHEHTSVTLHFDVRGSPPATATLTVRDVTGGRTLLEQAAAAGTFDVGPHGFPMGVSAVVIEIADAGQVIASATVAVHVENNINYAPVITGAGPRTIELQGPLTTLDRTLLGIEISDDCDPNPMVTFAPEAVPLGTTQVTVTAVDASGGTTHLSVDVTVVDTTPPTFTVCPNDITAECVNGSAWVVFDVAAEDLSGVVVLACRDETGRTVDPAGTSFEDGMHTVACTASDSSGNEATSSFSVSVEDNTAPVIVCPEDIMAPNEPGQSFAYVTFAVTATDACDPSVPITCAAPWGPVASGDAFPVGLTDVTCTARDHAGNEATCAFRILVRDVEPPVISCPATAVLYTDAAGSPLSIGPTDLGAAATDNCAGPIVFFCTPALLGPGDTTVVLTARDGDGNEATCDVGVTVLREGEVLTPTGDDVTVTSQAVLPDGSEAPVELSFEQVTAAGVTSVTTASTGPPPPQGFKLGAPPIYYDVTTTVRFTGTVELCFTWAEGQVKNESKLRLFHREGTKWVDVTTSLDTTSNIICGTVTSLSPFIVAEVEYGFDGFLAPVNADGSSLFKAGRAVPLKFRLRDPTGAIVADAVARLRVWRTSAQVTGSVEEEVPADAAGQANDADLFRYDATTETYVFNLQTKGWAKGTYRAEARLDDGSVHGVVFSIRE